jgi:quinolinate synthase
MADLRTRIQQLQKDRDAVILAHYYVDDAVQDIADFVGDSYYLSKIATQVPERVILFCGVRFMAESAKILNPEKTVIMPDATADCPMAHMVDAATIRRIRAEYGDLAVVCYINSTAEIKALSDVCVTSANAEKIIRALPEKNILFVPDQHLGRYVAARLPEKNFIYNEGYCIVHTSISADKVKQALQLHPGAQVLAHPECTAEVTAIADYIGSTSGIIDYAAQSEAKSFIICTEIGVLNQLKKVAPGKAFYFVGEKKMCVNMKKITLEKMEQALLTLADPITLPEDLRRRAEHSLRRMHQLAG